MPEQLVEVLLPELEWVGPYRLYQGAPGGQVDDIDPTLAGVYLWGIPSGGRHYPYYVGEAQSLQGRIIVHRQEITGGSCWVYDPDQLSQGTLKPIYNPNTDQRTFDGVWNKAKEFALLLHFFILPFPPDPAVNCKGLRLRVELGLARAIGKYFKGADGPNVWDQTCGPTHERNKRLESDPEVRVRFAVPDSLIGVPTELVV